MQNQNKSNQASPGGWQKAGILRGASLLIVSGLLLTAAVSSINGLALTNNTDNSQGSSVTTKIASETVPGKILVVRQKGASKQDTDYQAGVREVAGTITSTISEFDLDIITIPDQANTNAVLATLQKRRSVKSAEADQKVKLSSTVNDQHFSKQWHLTKIQAPTAWDTTTGSSNVITAILDTGVDSTQPDLQGKLVSGWNFYDNNNDFSDVYGHGTAVAGTVAAATNNTSLVASVGYNTKLMPLRISDVNGYGYTSTIVNALNYAANNGAKVANLSYNMNTSSAVSTAAQYFVSKGGVLTMSAGNYSTNVTAANNPYFLTVGATNEDDSLASFSNYGNNLDIVAPGVSVVTTSRGSNYGYWSGTSFSAPIVAGVAALVFSVNPSLTSNQVQDIIKQSADDKGTTGWDTTFGAGRVNATRAVLMAKGDTANQPPEADTTAPTASITSPLNSTTVSGQVNVQVTANDNVGVSSVSLKIDSAVVASSSTAPYSFNWNTVGLSNGNHTLIATAQDAAGNVGTSSTVTVNVSNGVADNAVPTVTITQPVSGTSLSNKNIQIAASATDNVGINKITLYLDGALQNTCTISPATANATCSSNLSTKSFVVGKSYEVTAVATDSSGNTSATAKSTFTFTAANKGRN